MFPPCTDVAAHDVDYRHQQCRWPELPLDVLCSIAGRLPQNDRTMCETTSPAFPASLRLVCRDWCTMLDTSIVELKFGEEWPHLTRVVTRFPFLHTLDFSACTLTWVHDAEAGEEPATPSHAAAAAGPAAGVKSSGLGPRTPYARESSRLSQPPHQSDSAHALVTAFQPLTQLAHLETLKVGYAVLKLLQQSSMGESGRGGERDSEFGFTKESPPYSPVSRLLSRLQASTQGNTGGNMDRMDGIDQVPAQPAGYGLPHSPRLTPLRQNGSASDTHISDQDSNQLHSPSNQLHSPSRMGGVVMGGSGHPAMASTPRGSRLRVTTWSESASRSPAGVSRAIFASPCKTPRTQPPIKLSPLDQFTQLLDKLTHLKEFHVVIRETDNLAVYKLAPKPTAPNSLQLLGMPNVNADRRVVVPQAAGTCMPMTLFNGPFLGMAPQAHDAAGAGSLSAAHGPQPVASVSQFVQRGLSPGWNLNGTLSSSSPSLHHPLNAAFFSSAASTSSPSPSTPVRWHSLEHPHSSPLPSPALSASPMPSIISANCSPDMPPPESPSPQTVFPQPTPPPSSPTTPPPAAYNPHTRQSSQHMFSFSPLSSSSSSSPPPQHTGPEAGPCVQLGRRLQLPASFGQLQLSFLFLRSQNLQILPACIGALTTMQELCLPANGLANLPYTMSRLQQLKALDLSDNRLRSSGLLLALSALTPLQHLNLHRNRLLDTSFLHHLNQLHYLDLGSNKLKTLTHLGNMSCLHTLDLSNNHLSILPDEISTLVALDFLDVRRNRLSMLPACLGCLTGLTYVNASHNYIRSVDVHTLSRLSRLQTLNLADNCLRDIPETIRGCSSLGHLNLSCNQLDSLPASISALTQLSALILNSNEVEELVLDNLPLLCNVEACDNYLMRVTLLRLPCLEHLKLSGNYLPQLQLGPFPKLRYLHLSANHLEQVQLSSLPSLIFLDLSHNLLTEVPAGVCGLTALQLLFLSANRLTHVPPMLADLSQLTALHMDKNKLVEVCWSGGRALLDLDMSKNRLQRVSVRDCPVLHTLSLPRNELESEGLQLSGLPDMQILDLGKNKMGEIPECVMELSSLRRLDLSHNQLPHLPPTLSKLTHLAELTVKDNLLLELPDVLASLEALTFLDVASNPLVSISPQLNRLTSLRQLYLRHISGRPLWTMDTPSPTAGGEPFSPSSQGPMSAVSSMSDLPPVDGVEDASSQPALPLPPVEGVDAGATLPADITQTVLADITSINVAASRGGLPADQGNECEADHGDLDRLLAPHPDSASGEAVDAGSFSGWAIGHDPSSSYDPAEQGHVPVAEAGVALGVTSRTDVRDVDVAGGFRGKGPVDSLLECLPDLSLSAVCCLPPIRAGSRDNLLQSSTLLSECVASTSRLTPPSDPSSANAGNRGVAEPEAQEPAPSAAAPSAWAEVGDCAGASPQCRSCGACPDCLGRMLALSSSWTPWDAQHTTSLSTAPSLESSYSIPSSSFDLPRAGCISMKSIHVRHDSSSADSAAASASDVLDLGRSASLESTSNTNVKDSMPCSDPSDFNHSLQFTQPFSAIVDDCLMAPPAPKHGQTGQLGGPSAFSAAVSGSGSLPPLVPARSPAAAEVVPSGPDMQEWGETSVWLLLLQLFSLSSHEVPMPLPHALVSLEISNPACKVKVDRDVGILIARVLAKLTRAAAQFMRSLERNSPSAAGVPGGSFLHSHDFAMRLKTGYGVLLRLVRRHYGLRLEALDLDAECLPSPLPCHPDLGVIMAKV